MNPTKLIASLAVVAVMAGAASAEARTNLNLDIGVGEPAYVAPAPVYAAPAYVTPAPVYVEPGIGYYNGRDLHRHYDWNYWHGHPNPGGRWHR